jgi:hypothetical protein
MWLDFPIRLVISWRLDALAKAICLLTAKSQWPHKMDISINPILNLTRIV